VTGRQLGVTEVKRLNRGWRRRTEARIGLLLDDVGQPFNVAHVWLCGSTALPGHPSVRKTALGTDRLLSLSHLPSGVAAADAAAADGYRLVAIELASEAIPLHEAPLAGDVCLAVGNEDHGCSAALLAAADLVTYIPLPGRVGSLNVAAATAIGLAEVRRREWTDETG
jgi:tRNA (guanosine-2'-O-)-methyltransferase